MVYARTLGKRALSTYLVIRWIFSAPFVPTTWISSLSLGATVLAPIDVGGCWPKRGTPRCLEMRAIRVERRPI